ACRHGIIWRLIDDNQIVFAHRHVEGLELASHIEQRLSRDVHAPRRIFDLLGALVCPIGEHDVGRHRFPPSICCFYAAPSAARRSSFAAMMKSFSCSPLIFFVRSETVAYPQPKLTSGWCPSSSASAAARSTNPKASAKFLNR